MTFSYQNFPLFMWSAFLNKHMEMCRANVSYIRYFFIEKRDQKLKRTV